MAAEIFYLISLFLQMMFWEHVLKSQRKKNKGKPGPPAFVKMFCVIHPGLFDSRTG